MATASGVSGDGRCLMAFRPETQEEKEKNIQTQIRGPIIYGGHWKISIKMNGMTGGSTEADELWEKIKTATEAGLLGDRSSRTKGPNDMKMVYKPFAGAKLPDYFYTFEVHTRDMNDEEDFMRVREELRKLGVLHKIPYKTVNDMVSGFYGMGSRSRIYC